MKRYIERIEKEAIQLTHENMAEVMKWCNGTHYTTPPMRAVTGISFFSLGYLRIAIFGNWIVKEGDKEFNIYTDDAFVNLFVEAPNIDKWLVIDKTTGKIIADNFHDFCKCGMMTDKTNMIYVKGSEETFQFIPPTIPGD